MDSRKHPALAFGSARIAGRLALAAPRQPFNTQRMMDMEQERILCGWKAIEAYTGLTRKTILARGYPVRKSGGVYAFQDELDAARRMARRLVAPAGAARRAAGMPGAAGVVSGARA